MSYERRKGEIFHEEVFSPITKKWHPVTGMGLQSMEWEEYAITNPRPPLKRWSLVLWGRKKERKEARGVYVILFSTNLKVCKCDHLEKGRCTWYPMEIRFWWDKGRKPGVHIRTSRKHLT